MTTVIFSVPPVKQIFGAVCEMRVGRVIVRNTYSNSQDCMLEKNDNWMDGIASYNTLVCYHNIVHTYLYTLGMVRFGTILYCTSIIVIQQRNSIAFHTFYLSTVVPCRNVVQT